MHSLNCQTLHSSNASNSISLINFDVYKFKTPSTETPACNASQSAEGFFQSDSTIHPSVEHKHTPHRLPSVPQIKPLATLDSAG